VRSHVSPTSRDRPLPSDPTTTRSGWSATSRSSRLVVPSASRPRTNHSSRAQNRRNDRSATSRRCRVWGESGLAPRRREPSPPGTPGGDPDPSRRAARCRRRRRRPGSRRGRCRRRERCSGCGRGRGPANRGTPRWPGRGSERWGRSHPSTVILLRIIVISRSKTGHRGETRAPAPPRRTPSQGTGMARTRLSVPSADGGMSANLDVRRRVPATASRTARAPASPGCAPCTATAY